MAFGPLFHLSLFLFTQLILWLLGSWTRIFWYSSVRTWHKPDTRFERDINSCWLMLLTCEPCFYLSFFSFLWQKRSYIIAWIYKTQYSLFIIPWKEEEWNESEKLNVNGCAPFYNPLEWFSQKITESVRPYNRCSRIFFGAKFYFLFFISLFTFIISNVITLNHWIAHPFWYYI